MYMRSEDAVPELAKIDFSNQKLPKLIPLTTAEHLIYDQRQSSLLYLLFRDLYKHQLAYLLEQYTVSATRGIYLFTLFRNLNATPTTREMCLYKIDIAQISALGSLDATYLDQLGQVLKVLPCTLTEDHWKYSISYVNLIL